MKNLKPKEQIIVITELAPWFTPRELKERFGLTNAQIYHCCNKYGILKSRENLSKVKQEFLDELAIHIADKKIEKLTAVMKQISF